MGEKFFTVAAITEKKLSIGWAARLSFSDSCSFFSIKYFIKVADALSWITLWDFCFLLLISVFLRFDWNNSLFVALLFLNEVVSVSVCSSESLSFSSYISLYESSSSSLELVDDNRGLSWFKNSFKNDIWSWNFHFAIFAAACPLFVLCLLKCFRYCDLKDSQRAFASTIER